MTLFWWDDAIREAHDLAASTNVRHRVFRTAGGWTIELAEMAVLTEACS